MEVDRRLRGDGLFAGFDPQKRSYDRTRWAFALDAQGQPRRDPQRRVAVRAAVRLGNERAEIARTALNDLYHSRDEQAGELLYRHVVQGEKLADLARQNELPIGTVKAKISRGMAKLRASIVQK